MAVSKAKKAEQLSALEAHLKEANSVGFTSNQKITVAEVTALKKDLRSQNALFLTAKKTLIRIAFKNVHGVDLDLDTLPGQVAMVIAKGDAIAPLGVANKYANEKDWKKAEKMVFVGGYFEGKVVDAETIRKVASLPSREVLLSKLLGSLMSPLSGLARFFDSAKKELEGKSLAKVADLTVAAPEVKAEDTPAEAPKAEAEEAPAEVPAE